MFSGGKTISFLWVLLSLLLLTTIQSTQANWSSGYIGSPSFNINSDPELRRLDSELSQARRGQRSAQHQYDSAQNQLNQLDFQREQTRNQLSDLERQQENDRRQVTEINRRIHQLQSEQRTLIPQISNLQRELEAARRSVTRKQSRVNDARSARHQISQRCDANPQDHNCPQELTRATTRLNNAQRELQESQRVLNRQNQSLTQAQQRLQTNRNEISEAEGRRYFTNGRISSRQSRIVAKRNAMTHQTAAVRAQRSKVAQKGEYLQQAVRWADQAASQFNHYYHELVRAILNANRSGAQVASQDAYRDGQDESYRRGQYYGTQDGYEAGRSRGVLEGQQREYQSGHQEGYPIGQARGEDHGRRDGLVEGRRLGNIDAATVQAQIDGEMRAKNSDAHLVGTRQGNESGMQRAISTGRNIGTPRGKQEAIRDQESISLDEVTLKGRTPSHADGFHPPSLPTDFRGNRYHNTPRNNFDRRHVVQRAYTDGYVFRYPTEVRRAFNSYIERDYSHYYQLAYHSAYREYLAQYYQESFDRGKRDGDKEAFERYYAIEFKKGKDENRAHYAQNPQTDSEAYQNTYYRVENQTYQRVYEEIRKDHYTRSELATFNKNIEEQTEIYRAKKYREITDIYSTNHVLKFVESTISDGGINEVGVEDGIFMPQEKIVYTLVIKNYGQQNASNVMVQFENGKSHQLTSIPGRSLVTVQYAGHSILDVSARDLNYKTQAQIFKNSASTGEVREIVTRHYQQKNQGLIGTTKERNLVAAYPLEMNSLSVVNSPLLRTETNTLELQFSNVSKRDFDGKIEFKIDVNSTQNIIRENFATFHQMTQGRHENSSLIRIDSMRDAYRPLYFTVRAFKNGVLIGESSHPTHAYAQTSFSNEGQQLVLLVDQEIDDKEFLDIFEDLGGEKTVSIFDVSLSANGQYLKDVPTDKTYISLLSAAKSWQALDQLLKNSQNNSLIWYRDHKDELPRLDQLQSLSSLNNSTSLEVSMPGLEDDVLFLFSNKRFNDQLKDSTPLLFADRDSFTKLLEIANFLKKEAPELNKKLSSMLDRRSYFFPSAQLQRFAYAYHAKASTELLHIVSLFRDSGGIFSRNTDIADLLLEDEGLIYNNLLSSLKSRSTNVDKFKMGLLALNSSEAIKQATRSLDELNDDLTVRTRRRVRKLRNDLRTTSRPLIRAEATRRFFRDARSEADVLSPRF